MDATFAGYRLVDPTADGPGADGGAVLPVVGPGRIAVVDAVEPSSGRRVRLILLPPIDGDLVRRTVVRARTVDHPHLLADVEVVQDGGRVGVVVPWTDGGTLARLLAVRGTISPAEVLTILRPLAGALVAVGDAGLCHGAVLPELVFFDEDGRPRLAGVGAGLALAVATGEDRILPVGAPHLAPEVARGAVPDIRADLFALGSLALCAVSGRPAWPAEDVAEVLVQSTAGLWPEADPRLTTPELAAIIDGLLSADPSLRPPAAVVQAELRSAGRPRPVDLTPLWSMPDELGGPQDGGDVSIGPAGGALLGRPSDADRWPTGAEQGRPPTDGEVDGWDPDDHRQPDGALDQGTTGAHPGPGPARGGPHRRRRRRPSGRAGRRGRLVGVAVVTLVLALVVGGGLWWRAIGSPGGPQRAGTEQVGVEQAGTGPVDADQVRATQGGADRRNLGPIEPDQGGTGQTGADQGGAEQSGAEQGGAEQVGAEQVGAEQVGTGEAGSGAQQDAVSPASAAVDWLSVVRELDRRRADALAAADPDLLDTVYVAGAARDADRALVADLRRRGLRIDGGAHVIFSAAPVVESSGVGADEAPATSTAPGTTASMSPLTGSAGTGDRPDVDVRVERSLPSYPVIDAAGATVGSTPSAAASAAVLTLRADDDGYAIVAVRGA